MFDIPISYFKVTQKTPLIKVISTQKHNKYSVSSLNKTKRNKLYSGFIAVVKQHFATLYKISQQQTLNC